MSAPSLGTISRRDLQGLKGRSKIIWAACPGCGLERWVPLKRPDILCRSCCGKKMHRKNKPQLAIHSNDCTCHRCVMTRGELTGSANPAWNGGRRTNIADGYVAIYVNDDDPMAEMRWKDDQYVLEHRLVIARHLGRPLKPHEYVHHVNGIKDDNRLENLELWLSPHPSGIRLLDYADEILKHLSIQEKESIA